ncbi:MAG: carboxypeptidase-like regulatory domain-containing protein [Flavobacteriales bacterium]|nr:carboxypeptidase-like regulatory domain-containing protein [Flavobacteriales bacterium]
MKVVLLAITLVLGAGTGLHAQERALRTISASVVDRTNKEPILFATVKLEGSELSALTDECGLFTLCIPSDLPGGKHYLTINYVGYQPMRYRVPRSVKGRVLSIKLQRIKFDLGDYE